jgi:predicted RNase H-like HicB family nuclease
MLRIPYDLVIEATHDPSFFGFYSPELEGFTGVGHSVEDCLYKALWGMEEHVRLLRERGLRVPARNADPRVTILNQSIRPSGRKSQTRGRARTTGRPRVAPARASRYAAN